MEYIRLKIKPLSAFAAIPSSDTFFGQICYTLAMQGEDMDNLLKDYENNPFLVVSDFFPMGYGSMQVEPRKPEKNLNIYRLANRKKDKNKNKVSIENLIKKKTLVSFEEACWSVLVDETAHVALNRFTNTPNKKGQGLYSTIDYHFKANDDDFFFYAYLYVEKEYRQKVIEAIHIIGQSGYGKKTTIGKGRYIVESEDIVTIENTGCNSMYLLSNCIISGIDKLCSDIFYTPFIRFGRHGAYTAGSYPYKNPYVMASQGALVKGVDNVLFNKAYIGKAVKNISYHTETIAQGYSLYIPLTIEG